MAINGRSRNWKKVFHEQLEEDAVEDTWRRRHRPLMNTALDNFGVESVRNNFRPERYENPDFWRRSLQEADDDGPAY